VWRGAPRLPKNPPVSPSDNSLPSIRATFLSLFLFSASLDKIPWQPTCLLFALCPIPIRREIDLFKEVKETAGV
jgi:hypothetical protein